MHTKYWVALIKDEKISDKFPRALSLRFRRFCFHSILPVTATLVEHFCSCIFEFVSGWKIARLPLLMRWLLTQKKQFLSYYWVFPDWSKKKETPLILHRFFCRQCHGLVIHQVCRFYFEFHFMLKFSSRSLSYHPQTLIPAAFFHFHCADLMKIWCRIYIAIQLCRICTKCMRWQS